MKRKLNIQNIILTVFLLLVTTFLTSCGERKQAVTKAEIGKPAPGFTLTDIQGKTWSLADLKGKVVLLNFWASWCAPCLEEIPSMVTLHGMLPSEYFAMVTILYNDRPDYAQNVVNKSGAKFPVLLDPDAKMARAYGLTGVPETFIIDPQGVLREKFIGPKDWKSDDAVALIEHYFPETYKKIVQ